MNRPTPRLLGLCLSMLLSPLGPMACQSGATRSASPPPAWAETPSCRSEAEAVICAVTGADPRLAEVAFVQRFLSAKPQLQTRFKVEALQPKLLETWPDQAPTVWRFAFLRSDLEAETDRLAQVLKTPPQANSQLPEEAPKAALEALISLRSQNLALSELCELNTQLAPPSSGSSPGPEAAPKTTEEAAPEALPSLKAIDAAISAMLAAFELRPVYARGLPYRPNQGALAPLLLQIQVAGPGHSREPAAKLWLRVHLNTKQSSQVFSVQSDAQGRAKLALPALLSESTEITAELDLDRLGLPKNLGLKAPSTRQKLRQVDPKALRIVLLPVGSGKVAKAAEASFLAEAERLLGPSMLLENPPENRDGEASLERTDLALIAASQGGAVDYVVLLDVDTQFVGSMGARSVWFEALARVELWNPWTGHLVGSTEHRDRAVALGEATAMLRASEKAAQHAAQAVRDWIHATNPHEVNREEASKTEPLPAPQP